MKSPSITVRFSPKCIVNAAVNDWSGLVPDTVMHVLIDTRYCLSNTDMFHNIIPELSLSLSLLSLQHVQKVIVLPTLILNPKKLYNVTNEVEILHPSFFLTV